MFNHIEVLDKSDLFLMFLKNINVSMLLSKLAELLSS